MHFLRIWAAAAAVVLGLGAGNSSAQPDAGTGPVVVELYTSQGCSSCPPADAFLAQLAQREDVLPLALHVDYWDYIGWKDSFGDPAHTKRQKAYAKAGGRRSIYTPQMIVQGAEHVLGAQPRNVRDLIRRHAQEPGLISLMVKRTDDGRLDVSVHTISGSPEVPAVVQLVRYEPRQKVKITKGENAGRTVAYTNIVKDWIVLGEWDMRQPFEVRAPIEGELPVAVIVQRKGPGKILAARRLP